MGSTMLQGSLGCSEHGMLEQEILGRVSGSPSELPVLDFREQTLGSSRMYLIEYQVLEPRRTEGPKNVAECQGSLPPS